MAKKNNFLVILLIFLVIGMIFYGSGRFSVVTGDCSKTPVIIDGVHVKSFDEMRSKYNVKLTDDELLELGYSEEPDGVYVETCKKKF